MKTTQWLCNETEEWFNSKDCKVELYGFGGDWATITFPNGIKQDEDDTKFRIINESNN